MNFLNYVGGLAKTIYGKIVVAFHISTLVFISRWSRVKGDLFYTLNKRRFPTF